MGIDHLISGGKEAKEELDKEVEEVKPTEPKSETAEAVKTIFKKGAHFNDDAKQVLLNRPTEEVSSRYDDKEMDKLSSSGNKEDGVELDEEVLEVKAYSPKSEMVACVKTKAKKGVCFNDDTKQVDVNQHREESKKSLQDIIFIPTDLVIDTDCITIGEKIGSGGFSDVYAATYDWKDGIDSVAMKSIKLESVLCSKKEIENLEREIMLLRSFRMHENVVTILGACSNAVVKDKEGNQVIIHLGLMMEISLSGSLFDYLRDPNSAISSQFCLYTCFDIANGMLALHSHSGAPILHRDLKSLNVLLFQSNSRKGFVAKISDFGLARMKKVSTLKATKRTGVGSPNWLPPESYDGSYKEASDGWEFGMVMYEIASRLIPFEGCQDNQIMKKVVLDRAPPDLTKVNSYFPEDLLVVMKGCWIYEAKNRPDFHTIVGILTGKLKENGLVISEKKKG